jgi:alanine racemase
MMDYVLVDVTDLPCVPKPGDVATVVGTQGKARIRLEEQSRRAGLIPYAFACALGPRLVRTVTDGQRGSLTTPLRRVA